MRSTTNSVYMFLHICVCNCAYIKHIVTIIYTSIFTQCYLYVKYFLLEQHTIITILIAPNNLDVK